MLRKLPLIGIRVPDALCGIPVCPNDIGPIRHLEELDPHCLRALRGL